MVHFLNMILYATQWMIRLNAYQHWPVDVDIDSDTYIHQFRTYSEVSVTVSVDRGEGARGEKGGSQRGKERDARGKRGEGEVEVVSCGGGTRPTPINRQPSIQLLIRSTVD